MKFFNFFEKHKTILLSIVTVVFIAVIGTSLFFFKVKDSASMPKKSVTIGGITSFDDEISLSNNSVLNQVYYIEELTYKKLGILLTLSDREDHGFIKVEISYGSNTFTKELYSSDIPLNKYTYIELPEEFFIEDSSVLSITLYDNTQNGFSVSCNKTAVVENSITKLNGQAIATNVVVDLRTDRKAFSSNFYLCLFTCLILFLSVVIVIIKIKQISFAAKTAFIASVLCLFYIFVFTPASVPDEPLHYTTAYHISNMMMFDYSDSEEKLTMRYEDAQFCENMSIALSTDEYIFTKENNYLLCKNNEKTETDNSYISGKGIVYLAPATGITVGRLLGLSAYWTFQLGRIFNIALFTAVLYFSVKIMPFGKSALAAISLIPINLHIMASNSYDIFTTSAVLLMFSYIVRLVYGEQKIGAKQLILLCLLVIFAVPHKVVYIGVAAILLIIPKKNFKNPRLHLMFKILLGILAIISVFVLQFANASKLTSETVTNSLTSGYSISYILANPKEIALMLFNSIDALGDFYFKSMFSYFGWFQLSVPWIITLPYVIVLLLSFMRSKDEPKALRTVEKGYALLLFAIVFLLVEFLLLIDHTARGSKMILGVQGRYFIPALPLLYLAIRNNSIVLKRNFDNIILFLCAACNVIILLCSLSCIYCI